MKCPKCEKKQRRGREGMTCKSCSYHFFFDPKKDRFSAAQTLHDALFWKIISNASASGSYHFTANQLFSSARFFVKKRLLGLFVAFVLVLAITVMMLVGKFLPGVLFAGFITVVLVLQLISRVINKAGITRKKWDAYVMRWLSSGREIPGLIHSPALLNPPEKWVEKDIYDYGVSGIILCNRPEIVDWLVLNNFHAQNNKLILTPSGYPDYLTPLAHDLLAATPELPVWLLHDTGATRKSMMGECVFNVKNVVDLGIDDEALSNVNVIRSRFPDLKPGAIPLDYIPYKTVSGAVGHCLVSGVFLQSVLGGGALGSDTDVSFG